MTAGAQRRILGQSSARTVDQEVDMSITTSARDALAEFRGTLIEPGDAGYDEARAASTTR